MFKILDPSFLSAFSIIFEELKEKQISCIYNKK